MRWTNVDCAVGMNNIQCQEVRATYAFFIKLQNRLCKRLEDIYKETIEMIPRLPYTRVMGPVVTERRPPVSTRKKRASGNWLAGVQDVERLDFNIRASATTTEEIVRRLRQVQAHLTIVTAMNSDRLSYLEYSFKYTNHMFLEAFRDLRDHVRVSNITIDIMRLTVKELSTHISAFNNMSDFKMALKRGLAGQLDSFFFSQQTVTQLLENVTEELISQHSSLRPAFYEYTEFLTYTPFKIRRGLSQLIFLIQLPLTHAPVQYFVYAVQIFPISMAENSSYSTVLHTKSKALIIANDRRRPYMELEEIPTVTSKYFDMSALNHIWKPRSQYSCLSAAHDDLMDESMEKCSFQVERTDFQPKVTRLDSQLLLLHLVPEYNVTCGNETTTYTNAAEQTLIRLGCNCSFVSHIGSMYENLHKCNQQSHLSSASHLYTYVVNLPVLASFFTRDEIAGVALNTLAENAMKIRLPEIEMIAGNLSEFITGIDDRRYDLEKVVQALVKRSRIFYSWGEYEIAKMKSITPVAPLMTERPPQEAYGGSAEFNLFKWDWSDKSSMWSNIMDIVIAIVACLSLLLSIVNLRRGAALPVVAARPVTAMASVISPRIFDARRPVTQAITSTTTVGQNATIDSIPVALKTDTNITTATRADIFAKIINPVYVHNPALTAITLIVLLIAVIAFLTVYVKAQRKKNQRHFYLMLEIANLTESVTLRLMKLPHSPLFYTYAASAELPRLALRPDCLYTYLKIDWPDFVITHTSTLAGTRLPLNVKLSWCQTRRLTRILDSEYTVLLYVNFSGLMHHLTIRLSPSTPVFAENLAIEMIEASPASTAPVYKPPAWSFHNLPSGQFV